MNSRNRDSPLPRARPARRIPQSPGMDERCGKRQDEPVAESLGGKAAPESSSGYRIHNTPKGIGAIRARIGRAGRRTLRAGDRVPMGCRDDPATRQGWLTSWWAIVTTMRSRRSAAAAASDVIEYLIRKG